MEQVLEAERRRSQGGRWILVAVIVLWLVSAALSAWKWRTTGERSALLSVPVSETRVEDYNGTRVYHTFVGGKVHVRTQILPSETLGQALVDHEEAVAVAVAGISREQRP